MSHHIETINKKIEIMKRKQIENLEMKSTITEIKNSLKSRKRKEWPKWTEPNRPLGHYQAYQHMHNGSPRKRGEREMCRNRIWRNNGWKVPKYDERHESINIQETQQTPSRINSKRSCQDTV